MMKMVVSENSKYDVRVPIIRIIGCWSLYWVLMETTTYLSQHARPSVSLPEEIINLPQPVNGTAHVG